MHYWTQQKIIIDHRKLLARILMKLPRRSGLQIDIMHFRDSIIGIKFQLGPYTSTSPIGFGYNYIIS